MHTLIETEGTHRHVLLKQNHKLKAPYHKQNQPNINKSWVFIFIAYSVGSWLSEWRYSNAVGHTLIIDRHIVPWCVTNLLLTLYTQWVCMQTIGQEFHYKLAKLLDFMAIFGICMRI